MTSEGHTVGARAGGWFHPLGRVRIRKRPDGTESLLTVLDATVCAGKGRIKSHEVTAMRTAEVDCDRIVRVQAVGRTSTARLTFETERVPGVPLASMLVDRGLEPEAGASLLLQIAYALSVAHRNLLLHGALTPWSIIVDPAGARGPVARITDFGVGWLSWEDHARNPELVPMSPERVLGLGRSPAEDAYLFGCVAYATFSGHPVFATGAAEDLRRRHAIEDAPPLEHRGSGRAVRYALRRFVMRCLSKEPEDRYKNGDALLVGLLEALADSGIATPFDDIGLLDEALPALPEPVPRDRTPVAVPTLVTPERTPVAEHVDRPPKKRRSTPPPPPPARRKTPRVAHTDRKPARPAAIPVALPPPSTGPHASAATRPPTGRRIGGVVAGLTLVAAGAWFWTASPREATPSRNTADAEMVPDDAAMSPIAPAAPAPAQRRHPGPGDEDDDPGDEDDAVEAVDDAALAKREIASDKADARILVTKAREARAAGDDEEAERLFKRALDNRAHHVGALRGLADLAFNRGDHREAIEYLLRAVKISPRNGDLRIRLGDAHYKLGQYAQARTQFEKAAALGHATAERRLATVEGAAGS